MEENKVELETLENIDFKDAYIRLLADYQNLQKRSSNEVISAVEAAKNKLLLEILPIYHDAKIGSEYKDSGAKLIYEKFINFLNNKDIEIINHTFFENRDNTFDENYACAIGITKTQDKNLHNKIHKVIEDGFINKKTNKVISFAKVFVFNYS